MRNFRADETLPALVYTTEKFIDPDACKFRGPRFPGGGRGELETRAHSFRLSGSLRFFEIFVVINLI